MKKLLLVLLFVTLLCSWSNAEVKETSKGDYPLEGSSTHTTAIREHVHEHTDDDTDTVRQGKQADDFVAGIKVDAPNLVKVSENTTIGLEGGKDLLDQDADDGWFVFLKFTWVGNLLDFTKEE